MSARSMVITCVTLMQIFSSSSDSVSTEHHVCKDWNLKNVCFYTVHLTALVQLNSVKKHFPIFIRNLETKYTAIKIN